MTDPQGTYAETFEIELEIRPGAEISPQDILEMLSHQSTDFRVRQVTTGDPLGSDFEVAWGGSDE